MGISTSHCALTCSARAFDAKRASVRTVWAGPSSHLLSDLRRLTSAWVNKIAKSAKNLKGDNYKPTCVFLRISILPKASYNNYSHLTH